MDLSALTGNCAAVLQAKRQSLMDLAKLFRWVAEQRADISIEERLSRMTPEERAEDARQLAERIKRKLEKYEAMEDGATAVEEVLTRRRRR